MIYIFKVYYNILTEAEIVLPNLEVEPTEFARVAVKRPTELTKNQIQTAITKLTNFYNNKFGFTSAEVKLDTIIQ